MSAGWGHPHRPSEAQAARAELAHELDVALHGCATFDGPITERRWVDLLDQVRGLASGSDALRRERLARVRQGLG